MKLYIKCSICQQEFTIECSLCKQESVVKIPDNNFWYARRDVLSPMEQRKLKKRQRRDKRAKLREYSKL